jgi:hypothetical protein
VKILYSLKNWSLMRNLILVMAIFVVSIFSYANTKAKVPSLCSWTLGYMMGSGPPRGADQSPYSEGIKEALEQKGNRLINAYVIVDLFNPIPNRGQKPAFVVAFEKISATGVTLTDDCCEARKIPQNGLTTFKVRATRDQIFKISNLPQVIWLSKTLNLRTLERIEKTLGRSKTETAKRRALEERLTKRAEDKIEHERRITQLESKNDEVADIRGQIEEVANEISEVEFNLSMTSAQSNDVSHRIRLQEDLADLQNTLDRLYETLDGLEQDIEDLRD